jgi:hypothetical protein
MDLIKKSGSWRLDWHYTNRPLGSADALSVAQAREMAREVATKIAKGESVKKDSTRRKINPRLIHAGCLFSGGNSKP